MNKQELIKKIMEDDQPIVLTTILKVYQHKIYEVDEFVDILDQVDGEDIDMGDILDHVYQGCVSDNDDYDIDRNHISKLGGDTFIDEKWDELVINL